MKYVVYIQQELYNEISYKKYHYECLTDSESPIYFNTFEEAKKYVDNYKLKIEKVSNALYVDYLTISKYNEETQEEDEEVLYNKALSYKEIETQEDIKLDFN